MIYTMFSLELKVDAEEEIKAILARYIAKHGKPPAIVEVHPENKDVKVGVPVLFFQYVQKQLVYLGEEQKGDENESKVVRQVI